ncbi:NADH-quinone oxidoreductase chain 2 [Rickettsiales bacterium Ac37b]|nr:NADH-quinone oxidoreductase chain 2 [Rickettsiales bacterium Ac37b]
MHHNQDTIELFQFTSENLELAQRIMNKYPKDRKASAVLPLLDLAQRQEGWVSKSSMNYIAHLLGMSEMKVYEVANFYTMFNLKPVGKYLVQICGTTPCWLRGAENIMNICKKHLSIAQEETTEDGLFTLKEVECLGACVNAPVIQINDDYYEDLDGGSIIEILDKLKNGEVVHKGSQIGRRSSEPFEDNSNVQGDNNEK